MVSLEEIFMDLVLNTQLGKINWEETYNGFEIIVGDKESPVIFQRHNFVIEIYGESFTLNSAKSSLLQSVIIDSLPQNKEVLEKLKKFIDELK